MQALLTRDDHAIVVVPIYQPSERAVTSICAATCVVLEDRGNWRLDIGKIAAAVRPNTRLVLMNFPNSPTGALIDPASLAALVGNVKAFNLLPAECVHTERWLQRCLSRPAWQKIQEPA